MEVAGQDEDESALRDKAVWYLTRGVAVVWLMLPATREVYGREGHWPESVRFVLLPTA